MLRLIGMLRWLPLVLLVWTAGGSAKTLSVIELYLGCCIGCPAGRVTGHLSLLIHVSV